MTEINNQNKLIADFMGYYMETINEGDEWTSYAWRDSSKSLLTWMIEIAPPFHSSWDWLMPVIEKITGKEIMGGFGMFEATDNEYKFKLRSGPNGRITFSGKTLIEAPYPAVVDFIRWYNQQTENKKLTL